MSVSWLEQLDQVPGGVGEKDLAPSGSCDHLAAETTAGVAEPVDFGVEVVDDEVDTVAAGSAASSGVARAPELAGPESSSRSGPRTTSAKAGAALVFTVKPRWVV